MTLHAQPDAEAAAPVVPTPPAARPAEDPGPRLHGAIDVLRPDRVAGWVIDRADARAHPEVEVRREGRVVARLRANRYRADLERGGIGTGRYGFAVALDPPLEPGLEFTLAVLARAGDGTEAALRPAGGAAAPPPPDRRLLQRVFEDLREVGDTTARTGAELSDGLGRMARAVERVEIVQARLEAALRAVEPPPRRRQTGLWAVTALALLVGAGSLALGAWSLWWG